MSRAQCSPDLPEASHRKVLVEINGSGTKQMNRLEVRLFATACQAEF